MSDRFLQAVQVRGHRGLSQAASLLVSVEQAWRDEIGPARFDIFGEVLAELAAELP